MVPVALCGYCLPVTALGPLASLMPRRTKQDAQITRERLLDTAERVFLARGLSRSSLQDIAQAAGLTRGAIYWHFADKLALFDAMMARVDLPLEQALASAEQALATVQAGGQPTDPLAMLRALALTPFALMQQDERARRVFTILLHRAEYVGELAPLAQRQDGAQRDCGQRMERLFQAAHDQGGLAPGMAPRGAAVALLALIDGLLRLCTASGDAVLPMVAPAINALLDGLSAGRPATAGSANSQPAAHHPAAQHPAAQHPAQHSAHHPVHPPADPPAHHPADPHAAARDPVDPAPSPGQTPPGA